MATLRHQIATNMLTVTRFRDLLKIVRANRPNVQLLARAVHAWRHGSKRRSSPSTAPP